MNLYYLKIKTLPSHMRVTANDKVVYCSVPEVMATFVQSFRDKIARMPSPSLFDEVDVIDLETGATVLTIPAADPPCPEEPVPEEKGT